MSGELIREPGSCAHPTKAGHPCRHGRKIVAEPNALLEEPGYYLRGCTLHATREELLAAQLFGPHLQAHHAHREKTLIESIGGRGWWSDPVCWSWPLPPPRCDVHHPDVSVASLMFDDFHDDEHGDTRCAACGSRSALVLDHDHATGLIRGLLCRGCNGQEPGAGAGHTLFKYRQRPPAAIVGLVERYVSPFTGPAHPSPLDEA